MTRAFAGGLADGLALVLEGGFAAFTAGFFLAGVAALAFLAAAKPPEPPRIFAMCLLPGADVRILASRASMDG